MALLELVETKKFKPKPQGLFPPGSTSPTGGGGYCPAPDAPPEEEVPRWLRQFSMVFPLNPL